MVYRGLLIFQQKYPPSPKKNRKWNSISPKIFRSMNWQWVILMHLFNSLWVKPFDTYKISYFLYCVIQPFPYSHPTIIQPPLLCNQNFHFLAVPNRIFSETFTLFILEESACHAFRGKMKFFVTTHPPAPFCATILRQTKRLIAALPLLVNMRKSIYCCRSWNQ